MHRQKPREIAFHILLQHEKGHSFIESLLDKQLLSTELSPADKGLLAQLVYGVVRWKRTLEYLIALKTPGRRQKPGLRLVLSLGLYQLFWLDRIPEHAAVHESVELAKSAGFGPQAGFINAILRAYVRETKETESLLGALARDNPPVGLSHPDWLFHRWVKSYGQRNAERLLQWNNTPPQTYARINLLKANVEPLKIIFAEEGVEVFPKNFDWVSSGLTLQLVSHPPLHQLSSFNAGMYYIQDPSTLLAVRELDAKPGEKILDVCAAPGGKTSLIAQEMRNQGLIIASDSDPERLKLIIENCQRLGVDIVRPVISSDPLVEREAPYDRILVDVPCSNTGVMRRRIDLRWRLQNADILKLAQTQGQILNRAAQLLRKGGRLVYSTCSLESEENHDVITEFLSNNVDFVVTKQRALSPFRDDVDGAFVSVLERKQF